MSKKDPRGHSPTALPVLVADAKPQAPKRVFVRKSIAPQMAWPPSVKAACVCCAFTSEVLARILMNPAIRTINARQSM